MNRLTQLLITGIVAAEVAGWVMVGTMFQFFSVGFSSRFGVLIPVGIVAVVGALVAGIVWLLTREQKQKQASVN